MEIGKRQFIFFADQIAEIEKNSFSEPWSEKILSEFASGKSDNYRFFVELDSDKDVVAIHRRYWCLCRGLLPREFRRWHRPHPQRAAM